MAHYASYVGLLIGFVYILGLFGCNAQSLDDAKVIKLNKTSGSVTSDGWPGSYPAGYNSAWMFEFAEKVTAPKIFVTFDVVNLRRDVDYLLVSVVGTNETIVNLTGNADVTLTISQTNGTVIEFVGQNSSTKAGGPFKFRFNYTTTGCHYDLPDPSSGTFRSPFYQIENGTSKCSYGVQASSASRVLSFNQFRLKGFLKIINENSTIVIDPVHNPGGLPRDLGLNATSTRLELHFSTALDKSGVVGGFGPVSKECTMLSHVIDNTTVVTSPGYPYNNYGNNLNCRWSLDTPPNTTAQLTFVTFDLAEDADRLVVKDGNSKGSPLLGSFGAGVDTSVVVLRTSGQGLWLQFTTDESGTNRGFKVMVDIQVDGGSLEAPVGNRSVAESVSCCTQPSNDTKHVSDKVYYLMRSPDFVNCQMAVMLKPEHTKLYPTAWFDLHDGSSVTSPKVATFRAQGDLFYPVVATGNAMLLVANGVYYPQTFSFDYYCSNVQAQLSVKSATSGVSDIMNNSTSGSMVIYSNEMADDLIVLRLTNLALDKDSSLVISKGNDVVDAYKVSDVVVTVNESFHDDLQVYVPGLVGARFDYSLGQSTAVVNHVTKRVFTLAYETISASVLEKSVTTLNGELSSANYPSNYPYGVKQRWSFAKHQQKTLFISFQSFKLGVSARLSVLDDAGKPYKVYTSASPPPQETLLFVNKTLTLEFESKTKGGPFSFAQTGFKLSFTTLDDGADLIAPVGNKTVAATASCCRARKNGTTHVGKKAVYKLRTLNLTMCQMVVILRPEHTTLYPTAQIDMYDGPTMSSPRLATFRAVGDLFYPIVATGNAMMLVANDVYYPEAFSFDYYCSNEQGPMSATSAKSGARDIFSNSTSGRMVVYSAKMANETIVVRLGNLNLDKGSSVVISRGHDLVDEYKASDIVLTVTGSFKKDLQVNVPGRYGARIDYKLSKSTMFENSVAKRVFTMAYETVPSSVSATAVTSKSGDLMSPGYPSYYPYGTTQRWNFTNHRNKILYASFQDFHLGSSARLAIFNKQGKPYKTYSAASPPPKEGMISVRKFAVFEFDSQVKGQGFSFAQTGFKMNYTTLDCGGVLSKSSGSISVDPKKLPRPFRCIWVIKVKPNGANKSVNVINYDLLFKNKQGARTKLNIRDGDLSTAPIANTTGNATKGGHRVILSRINSVWIELASINSGKTPLTFSLSYKTQSCSKMCDNGICMQPGWRCDGVNQCGDGSDEFKCVKETRVEGISSVAFGLTIVAMFFVGIIVAAVLPKIYYRCRGDHRYDHLRETMTPVPT